MVIPNAASLVPDVSVGAATMGADGQGDTMADTPERPDASSSTGGQPAHGPGSGHPPGRDTPPGAGPPPGAAPPPGYGPPGYGPPGFGPPGFGPAGYGPLPGDGPPPAHGSTPPYGPPPGGYGPQPGPGAPSGFHTAPRPGIIPLRPLGLGELYGGAFAYLRQNPGATLLPSFLVALALQIVQLVLQVRLGIGSAPTSLGEIRRYLTRTFVVSGVSGLLSLLLVAVLSAVLVTVLRGALIGRRTSLGQAWRAGARRVPGLLGVALLVAVVVVVLGGVGYGLAFLLGAGLRGAVGVLLGVVVGLAVTALLIYVALLLTLAVPAYAMEDIGVVSALRRSAQLVRGQWWRIFGIVMLAALIVGAVVGVLGFAVGAISTGTALSGGGRVVPTPAPAVRIFGVLIGVVVGTVYTPYVSGLVALLYVDQRIRRERFDLQLATSAAAPR